MIWIKLHCKFTKKVEQRKREKQEERLARERVKQQIEQDKLARKAKSNPAAVQSDAPTPAPSIPSTVAPAQSSTVAKNYKETKIQIRLLDGSTVVETFDKNEQLAAVRLFVQLKLGLDAGISTFGMMMTFPRKVFVDEDYEKTLEELNLIPSATLMITKNP